MLNGEAAYTNFKGFGLTRPWLDQKSTPLEASTLTITPLNVVLLHTMSLIFTENTLLYDCSVIEGFKE